MGAITQIAWCDATFNPWVGCLRVSTACDRCYAAALSWRYGWRDGKGRDLWDPGADRKRTSSAYWRGPLRWSERAQAAGTRRRVFCASMADVFDNKVPKSWRVDLWSLIRSTPALDWFLLTKRPQNIGDMLPPDWGKGWPHVWLGTTTENQEEPKRRIPHLVVIPAALAQCIPIGCEASATRCTPLAPSYSSSKSAAITRSGQLSPARAKTRHNGRSICGCRNSRSEVLPAHRAARAQTIEYPWRDGPLHDGGSCPQAARLGLGRSARKLPELC